MAVCSKKFGFYPERLQSNAGPIKVRPLPEFQATVDDSSTWEEVESGWIYAPPQGVRDFLTGKVRELPYSARVFGLPKTHVIKHKHATGDDHVVFLVWALSFFLGMRLTTEEAGFLDATPIEPRQLVDFVPVKQSLTRAVELADSFWKSAQWGPENALRFAAGVHALFLGQYPRALQFEKFIYLYTAIDACYRLTTVLQPPTGHLGHHERIEWMCGQHGLGTPAWATTSATKPNGPRVAPIRNATLHEGLFMDEPLGFAAHPDIRGGNLVLEMSALVCRLLVALIGGHDRCYLGSPINTRQRYRLNLCS